MTRSMVSPPNFSDVAVPEPLGNAERQSRYRTEHPTAKHDYRHNHSKWQTDATYLSRGFVAWDGEGITDPDGSHRYVMLAVKSDTDGDYMGAVRGLGTAQIFDFVLATAEREAGSIHVIYGGGYDFNMWMRDISNRYCHVFTRTSTRRGTVTGSGGDPVSPSTCAGLTVPAKRLEWGSLSTMSYHSFSAPLLKRATITCATSSTNGT